MSPRKARAAIEVEATSEMEAEIIYNSIRPEAEAAHMRRGGATVKLKNRDIIINIEAEDVAPLRALALSYLRWISMALKILRIR